MSIKNANIALLFYVVGLVLNFISRKFFIDFLGADILGLNTIVFNLLSFLNLAELGLGSAISFTLYKPLHQKEYLTIEEIITVQGYIYRNISYVVLFASFILMLFFPIIFNKANLPLWYAYSSFSVLLLSSLMEYIWNYKQILLTADQKQYKITIAQQSITLFKVVCQIFLLIYFRDKAYISWLLSEVLFATIKTVVLSLVIKKEYPWLRVDIKKGKELLDKHVVIISKTKQLCFHKIGGFVLSQTSSIIIYSFASLVLVASYGNYMLIISGLLVLMNSVFNGISACVGDLVAEGDQTHVLKVFWELFSFRFYMVSVAVFCFYYLVNPFITLWVGSSFLLPNESIVLIVLIFYLNSIRAVVDLFVQAYGLFSDVWATIIEACLNLGLSILLGYFWGINGVLLGVLISLFLIVHIWKPYFLFRYGFNISYRLYVSKYICYLLVLLLMLGLNFLYVDKIKFETSIEGFCFYLIKTVVFNFVLLMVLLSILFKEMRSFMLRVCALFRNNCSRFLSN